MVARQVIEVVNMDRVGIKWTGHINNIILQASTTAITCFAWECCVCAASKIFPAGNATTRFFSELDDWAALAACADCLLTTLQPAARLPQAALGHSSSGVACNVLQSWNRCSLIFTINNVIELLLLQKGYSLLHALYSISKLENSSCLQLWCWRPQPLACIAQRSDQLLALTNGPATVDTVKWEQKPWCPLPRILAAVRVKPYYLINIYLVFIENGDNIIDHQCVVCCVLYYRNMTLKTRTMGMLHVYLSSLLIWNALIFCWYFCWFCIMWLSSIVKSDTCSCSLSCPTQNKIGIA